MGLWRRHYQRSWGWVFGVSGVPLELRRAPCLSRMMLHLEGNKVFVGHPPAASMLCPTPTLRGTRACSLPQDAAMNKLRRGCSRP